MMAAPPSWILLKALEAADPPAPQALHDFSRVVGAPNPAPDFLEWSVRIGAGYQAARLTYYFDVARCGGVKVGAVLERFAKVAMALVGALPEPLLTAMQIIGGRREVLQIVVGIDERPGQERRVKLYLVLQEAAPELIESLLGAVGYQEVRGMDLAKVYILGLDVSASGVEDAKLYVRLDRKRLGQVVENLPEVGELWVATREVVFQRCLKRDRSQVYLHMDNPSSLVHYLMRRSWVDREAARLVDHHARVQQGLGRGRLEPWIISFGYRHRKLLLGGSNVYFHWVGAEVLEG
ncbi:MAG: hypothetical protein RMJ98_05385 [Myxococcales bacterium]|nr:hypothetical protein [Polyangiaceae bacterium]MDW8248723.1 hypothetical protein [Myxococcales bacterium]